MTLPHQYEPLKLSGPVFAGIYKSGIRFSGAVFEKGWPIKAGIECEMVARMAKDVTAASSPYTADTIKPFETAIAAASHEDVELSAGAFVESNSVVGANGPVTLRLILFFDSPKGPFQHVVVQQVNDRLTGEIP